MNDEVVCWRCGKQRPVFPLECPHCKADLVKNPGDEKKNEEKKAPTPKQLVDCMKHIEDDAAIKVWRQFVKIQYIVQPSQPLTTQLCLDRVHRYQPSKSKPIAYFHMSSADQHINLARIHLAAACVLELIGSGHTAPSPIDMMTRLNSVLNMIQADTLFNIKSSIIEIGKKRLEKIAA